MSGASRVSGISHRTRPRARELDLPLGIVEAIAGQTRAKMTFRRPANHAGTTPMHLRKDALAGAAEWIGAVEREAKSSWLGRHGRKLGSCAGRWAM